MSDKNSAMIKRELKIDNDANKKHFSELDQFLKTISKKFDRQPISLENLDKAYLDIVEKNKTDNKDKLGLNKKSKKQEEKAIFYDIFIKPKENKIKELTFKREEQKKILDNKPSADSENKEKTNENKKFFISNKLHDVNKNIKINNQPNDLNKKIIPTSDITGKNNTKENYSQKSNNVQNEKIIISNDNESESKNIDKNSFKINISSFVKIDENYDPSDNLLKFLYEKFIPISKESLHQSIIKKNFFNQLIQIKPPEGINAVVASPLMDSKGWAPSIPSIQIDKTKTNLNDLMMRAKGGIQAGDIPKEAHMAFYLGLMNEEEKKYEEALKFYKKYFLSAKLLQDIYGTELALNRIAVIYSNLLDFGKIIFLKLI